MNISIDTKKVERLNALKAEQERIEKELAIQEKLAKNESKKIEAVSSAISRIDSTLQAIDILNASKRGFLKELQAINPSVTISETKKSNFETPYTYLLNEQDELERWDGEPIPYICTHLEIQYNGCKIGVDKFTTGDRYNMRTAYKMTLCESITGRWNSSYTKAETVITKINEYIAQQDRKRQDELNRKQAYKDGLAHLKFITPKGTKIEQKSGGQSYSKGRGYGWISWQEFHISLPNGNRVVYKVTANTRPDEPSFNLILISFKDARIEEVKKTPETLIDYLK